MSIFKYAFKEPTYFPVIWFLWMHAKPVNFVFVWVPVIRDKVVKVLEPLPNRLIKQQQEVDS